jgi:hypothetical protein
MAMTPEAKRALSSTIRSLRSRLLDDLHGATDSAYRLSVAAKDAGLSESEKTREKGRVVRIVTRVVFGTIAAVTAALGMSRASRAVNTSFVERQNGTDRHRNARKARKTYRFSKDWRFHEAVTYLTLYTYNFCWPVRTLWLKDGSGGGVERSPAMAAELTDHVWSMSEWLRFPAARRS